jgi:hypothetical protein
MRFLSFSLLIGLGLAMAAPVEAGNVERIELYQKAEVMAQQQRLVGNLRAVARREGVVLNVPQLYIYHGDFSEAYHREGFRAGFEREVGLILDRRRGARSMVRLDRLLERVKTPDGEPFGLDDLPEADFYLALYRRADCQECDQLAEHLESWLADQPERQAVWLDVRTDRRRD